MKSFYCCDDMKRELTRRCDQHPNRFECPDNVIHRIFNGEYGLIIHDGGSSFYKISYCPWCGIKLDTFVSQLECLE